MPAAKLVVMVAFGLHRRHVKASCIFQNQPDSFAAHWVSIWYEKSFSRPTTLRRARFFLTGNSSTLPAQLRRLSLQRIGANGTIPFDSGPGFAHRVHYDCVSVLNRCLPDCRGNVTVALGLIVEVVNSYDLPVLPLNATGITQVAAATVVTQNNFLAPGMAAVVA